MLEEKKQTMDPVDVVISKSPSDPEKSDESTTVTTFKDHDIAPSQTSVPSLETLQIDGTTTKKDSIGETSQSEVTEQKTDQSSKTPTSAPQSPPSSETGGSQTPSYTEKPTADTVTSKFDDFLASPNGNEIVEHSPGRRYVRFMEKLGSGASKDVYRAYDTQEGIEVAWNVVHLAGVPRDQRSRVVNEVQLLERLHHHNIISFHGSWVNRERQQVNFVTEILSSGTLKSFINKVQVIRWKIAKRWAIQILKGLEYLHSQDPPVIHRDLKCENIFYNGTSGDLRIGDLGLSTTHRHGKQLSVLGTPEFMAPDMYEDNPYDEKVDVYAFGMVMLEIFTKEVPYRECSNPAQIYKKVSRGDPPEVLRRIRSSHAREFIKFCLGYMDENGKYIRPSTTEVLSHDFLNSWPNDDDEVIVDPPVRERTISESTNPSTSSPNGKSLLSNRISPTSSSSHPAKSESSKTSSKHSQKNRSNSLEGSEIDVLNAMPDSESNMRKVTVMAGRNVELKEEDEVVSKTEPETSVGSNEPSGTVSVGSANAKNGDASVQSGGVDSQNQPGYLVAAAVVDSELNTTVYEDDILKLILTLPVEGSTKNVQFDFHLVEDDPIKVTKEMVAELGIPPDAVLEISETISGLACAARVNQEKYLARQQPGHVRSSSQTVLPALASLGTMPPATPEAIQPPYQGIIPSTSQQSLVNQQTMVQPIQTIVPQVDNVQHPVPAPAQTQQVPTVPQQAPAPPPHIVSVVDQTGGVESVPVEQAPFDPEGPMESATAAAGDIDPEALEELRKLDEEYNKTVMRAKKVFDSRMDNIQRIQHQKEAQHQRTLTEHEKQRAEFEKRLQQEEIEQNRRIEQLQKEWERKRQEVKLTQEGSAASSPQLESAIPPSEPTTSDQII